MYLVVTGVLEFIFLVVVVFFTTDIADCAVALSGKMQKHTKMGCNKKTHVQKGYLK